METMNIALPDTMKEFVEEQVQRGGYRSVSEYVGELIRADREEKARQALESEVLKGLQSGASTPMTPEDWQDLREEVRRGHAGKA
jgi:antitoxin ParD1/3/4